MKYFIVADVHGFYDKMAAALKAKGFKEHNPNHVFVSLGDLLYRGPQPNECLAFVNGLPDDRKILIMGNHELLMNDMLNRGTCYGYDKSNGTVDTVRDVTGERDVYTAIQMMRINDAWRDYYYSCQFYGEVGNNIFVHGWIPCDELSWGRFEKTYDWRNAPKIKWEDATWFNGMKMWNEGIREEGKTIWCGHWHTSWGHAKLHNKGVEFFDPRYSEEDYKAYGIDPIEHFEPFKDKGICAMDACTAYSGIVNCEVIRV